jgi:hypothetical protein
VRKKQRKGTARGWLDSVRCSPNCWMRVHGRYVGRTNSKYEVEVLIVALSCILISSKLFCQQMHSLLKHKMLQLTVKMSLYMASTCFGSFGPWSGSIRRNLAKVTVFVEIINKNTSLKLCCAAAICASVCTAVCVLGAVRRVTHYTHYRLKHILPLHSTILTMYFY